jgi:segregation and condensation protein B
MKDSSAPEPVEQLERSYSALLEQQNWEADVPESAVPDATTNDAARKEAGPPPLPRIIEALLFAGGAPLTATRACETIRGLTPQQFTQAVDALQRDYRRQGRPYSIQLQDKGYVLALRPRFKSVTQKLYGPLREARLSGAAVDVLSLVAYRQPATKQEIDNLRGRESGGVLRQLVRTGLIAVVQRGDAARREVTYGTTPRFLELFKLRGLDDLPQTQDLQKL